MLFDHIPTANLPLDTESEESTRLTCCSQSSSWGHQQHDNVLNDVRLEFVQVSRPVATR